MNPMKVKEKNMYQKVQPTEHISTAVEYWVASRTYGALLFDFDDSRNLKFFIIVEIYLFFFLGQKKYTSCVYFFIGRVKALSG